MNTYRNRRLIAMTCITLLAALAGFLWGREIGYSQGKADTIKAIEKRLIAPEHAGLPI